MHTIPILTDLLIIFGLAIPVIYLCHRLHIPTLVGLLITGIMIGPDALVVIESQHEVEVLAEIGIILLLFDIGLEFSLKQISRMKTVVLVGGTIQVLSATGLGLLGARFFAGLPWNQSIFMGFLVALSSTAIVLKMLQERGEIKSVEGQNMLGILIYQDVAIVPLMLLTPYLAGTQGKIVSELGWLLGASLVTIILVVVLARYIVPPALYAIAITRQRELFLLSIVFIGLLVCWFTAQMGLSLSLGAFLAGLIISESEYSHEAISHIIPFRDVFTSLFFVSMGILLNPTVLWAEPFLILLLTAGALVIGTVTAGTAMVVMGASLKTAFAVAIALNQVGEFSLILSRVGLDAGLMTENQYQLFLSVAVLSMMLTPFEYRLASQWLSDLSNQNLYQWITGESEIESPEAFDSSELEDHVIVVGFGPTGQHVVEACEESDIPYIISELNPNTVRTQQERGRPMIFGDAGEQPVLERLGITQARVLVITISNPSASRQIIKRARMINPDLHIISRSRFLGEVSSLRDLGADEVIPEELETSLEMFVRVLRRYFVSRDEIHHILQNLRRKYQEDENLSSSEQPPVLSSLNFSRLAVSEFRSEWIGKTLRELRLRNRFGVTVVAIERSNRPQLSPEPDFELTAEDILVVVGEPEALQRLRE